MSNFLALRQLNIRNGLANHLTKERLHAIRSIALAVDFIESKYKFVNIAMAVFHHHLHNLNPVRVSHLVDELLH